MSPCPFRVVSNHESHPLRRCPQHFLRPSVAAPVSAAFARLGRVSPSRPDVLPPVEPLIRRLTGVPGREDRLRHLEVLPAREAVHEDWPTWVPDDVRGAFAAQGVARPWRHQVVAADAAHAGDHVIVATGTASGKSLAYQLPALSAIRAARGPRGERGASVLYLAPTKALAHDQLAGLASLRLDVRLAAHDGDSSREERDWTRDYGEYVLTNPDMLHRSLLPSHHRWARLLGLPAVRRGRRVPPLPRRLRRARLPRAAPAAAGVRDVRRAPDVRARLGDRRRAGGDRRHG